MLPDDFGEAEFALIERCIADRYAEIRAVVREDVQETWGTLTDGSFNSIPVIELRLKALSKRPESTHDERKT